MASRLIGSMLMRISVALSVVACSYAATFAFANTTDEDGTLFLRFRRQNGHCPGASALARAPSSQLQRGWLSDPSPRWALLAADEFTYSNLDCSILVSLPARKAIAIARVSNLMLEHGEWRTEFPVEVLEFRSASHSVELQGSSLLERFERQADLLFVASVRSPAAQQGAAADAPPPLGLPGPPAGGRPVGW